MTRRNSIAALGLSALLLAGGGAAHAGTAVDTYPETPATNNVLPIVHTYHGSDHIKANILNPSPVCNAGEDFRTTVYQAKTSFTPAGTVSTTNDTKSPIPLTQTLSKTQSISLSVKGDLSQSTEFNAGTEVGGGKDSLKGSASMGITAALTRALGGEATYSLSWTAGQDIGPYDVPAGHTGEATYGFKTVSLTGVQQFCKANGTWSTPTAWSALAPIKNEVKVKLYDNATGSSESVGSSVTSNYPVYGPAPADEAKPAEGVAPDSFDLRPHFTTSSAKAEGFAGSVALRVTNDGKKQYHQDDTGTPVRFQVAVKTAEGPEGVDRLITATNYNGAYVRDLGFDRASSTRRFEVTLSNPIEPGETQLVGALSFGDGNTKRGRIINYATFTQTGRVAGDVSVDNDQDQDSRKVTKDDFGRAHSGRF